MNLVMSGIVAFAVQASMQIPEKKIEIYVIYLLINQ